MKFVICNLKFLRKLLVKFQIVVSNGLNSQKIVVDLQKSFSSQKVQRKLTIIHFKPAASSTYDSHHRGKFVPLQSTSPIIITRFNKFGTIENSLINDFYPVLVIVTNTK
jgi:hypothetical protein